MEGIDAYIRVSRVAGREGESYISPSVQREAIERWADYKGLPILEWHTDEDWSGGASSRPGLDAAVDRAVAGQTGGIVSWKIDRFSRLTEQGLRDLRRLSKVGARLAFVVEDVDTATPIGKLVYTVMLAQAEYFLDQIKASWVTAKTKAVERGAVIGPTPLGYDRDENGRLRPGQKATAVSEAFRLAATDSVQAATQHLAKHVDVDYVWTTSHTRRLLRRRVYLGESVYGNLGNTTAHDPIVTRAVWESAQHPPRDKKPSENFPLSRLLRCGTCQGPLVGGRGGTGQRTYRCAGTMATRRGQCPRGVVVTASIVEDHLRDLARAELAGLRQIVIGDPQDAELEVIERHIADAEAELEAFAADLTLRRALGDRYHAHLASRVEAVDAAQAEYRDRAAEAVRAEAFDLEAMLVDDDLLLDGLRGIFDHVLVLPGRGKISDRVRVVPFDADGTTGISGLEGAE